MARLVLRRAPWVVALIGLSFSVVSLAVEPKVPAAPLEHREHVAPELVISTSHEPVEAVLDRLPNGAEWAAFFAAGGPARRGFVDPRSGAATSILDRWPLIPGSGAGNRVGLADLSRRIGRPVAEVDGAAVADAVLAAIVERRGLLGIDPAQLGPPRAVAATAVLWQVSVPQLYRGIPVRHGRVAATIGHGNLVVLGTETWGDVRGLSTVPRLTAEQARATADDFLGGASSRDEVLRAPALEIVPTAPPEHQEGERFAGPIGLGYRHRLVWTWAFRRPPGDATWEVIVDAHDGTLLAFQDLNQYAVRSITGGVYPSTSTEVCPTPGTCGTMHSSWPMPFADTGLAAPDDFANSAGFFEWAGGDTTTTLDGLFVRIVDSCGGIANSSQTGAIDLGGANGQHDCATGGGSAGNTAASRSAFYELNKLAEQARGWLPANGWLQSQLTANVNINSACNAFWNGSTVNFYRSGGGCRNTGEIAAIFDHEWGHGLDANDANSFLSNSSEAYADIAAIFRLQDSCVGHGFFATVDDGCGQTSDGTGFNADEAQVGPPHCDTDCSGVRDADWLRHADQTPDTALGFVCSSCFTGSGPCGRQVHCAAAPVRQAAWDLVARDLQAPPFDYDGQTAFLIGNKLFYQGSGNVGLWHACTCGWSSSGCGVTNGYLQWLAADDDNGDLLDGTPHMTAIHDAFARHGIACQTPEPQNSGCAGGPTEAPTLTAAAGELAAELSWSAVPNATRYWVFRTEGHAGCDFGKTLIAETTGTAYTDEEVAGDREYHYNVVAAGASAACFGRASACRSVTPTAPPPAPDFAIGCDVATLSVLQDSSASTSCAVSSVDGFSAAVALSCGGGLPPGAACAVDPPSVTPPADGSASATLTVTTSDTTPLGSSTLQVAGSHEATIRSVALELVVALPGPQVAAFDAALQAPKCGVVGFACDSGELLVSRDNIVGQQETNQPNTIGDSCADDTGGAFHADESLDRLVVTSVDGSDLGSGKVVRIDATPWVWAGGANQLDLYYAADAGGPSWQHLTTVVPPASGNHTFSAFYTLPAGALQAVRGVYRYPSGVIPSPCVTGGFNDHDDLVFAVCQGCGCTEEATISGQRILHAQVFEAVQTISLSEVTVASSGDLTLRAGARVALGNGFSVGAGGRLRVVIGAPAGCP